MPDYTEIIAECRKHAESFEMHWALPWYKTKGSDRVWAHPLLRLLLNLPDEVFEPVIGTLLREKSFALRGVAVHLSLARRARSQSETIRDLLAQDESVPVRAMAAATLGGLGLDSENLAALFSIPEAAHPEIKKAAIMAIRVSRCADGAPLIVRWLNRPNEDEQTKVAAAQALGELSCESAADALIAVLSAETEPDSVRAAAADSLARYPEPRAEAALEMALTSPRDWVHARALLAFAKLTPSRAISICTAAIRSKAAWMVRQAGVEALSAVGGADAKGLAASCLSDADPKIRAEACATLGKIGDPSTFRILGPSLDDPDLLTRIQAASALATISGRDFGIKKLVDQGSLDPRALELAVASAKRFIRESCGD